MDNPGSSSQIPAWSSDWRQAIQRLKDKAVFLQGPEDLKGFRDQLISELEGMGITVHTITIQTPAEQSGYFRTSDLGNPFEDVMECALEGFPWVKKAWASGQVVRVGSQELEQLEYPASGYDGLAEVPLPGDASSFALWYKEQEPLESMLSDEVLLAFAPLVQTVYERACNIQALREGERKQKELSSSLRAVVRIADELIRCSDTDALLRTAVERAHERLKLERCSIYLEDGEFLRGTYGIDEQGNVRDEHHQQFPKPEAKHSPLMDSSQEPRWSVNIRGYEEHKESGSTWIREQWVAETPIRSSRRTIGRFYNDTPITRAPFDETKQDTVAVFCSLLGNILELKQTEEQLTRYQERLRALASELSLAEERERHRIATELHDRIGQALTFAGIRLGELEAAAGTTDLAKNLNDLRSLIRDTIQDTRTLIFEISPPILYELGLEPALDWLAEQTYEKHGITVELESDAHPKPLGPDLRVLLFQSARELLFNVVKHASATCARIILNREGDQLHLTIEDDGVGFDVGKLSSREAKNGGFGLFSIRNRLELLGGRMEIESTPGRGTHITLVAPLAEELNEDDKLRDE